MFGSIVMIVGSCYINGKDYPFDIRKYHRLLKENPDCDSSILLEQCIINDNDESDSEEPGFIDSDFDFDDSYDELEF